MLCYAARHNFSAEPVKSIHICILTESGHNFHASLEHTHTLRIDEKHTTFFISLFTNGLRIDHTHDFPKLL